MKLINFLLRETEAEEIVFITDCGYIIASVYIDHEDLFSGYIDRNLAKKEVKHDYWKTMKIASNQTGEKQEVNIHFVEV